MVSPSHISVPLQPAVAENHGKPASSSENEPSPENVIYVSEKVSSKASHQHVHEQEMLLSFSVPEPPISTQELTLAESQAENVSLQVNPPRTLWMGDIDPWLGESDIVHIWWRVLQKKVSVKLIKPKLPKPQSYALSVHSGYCFVEFLLYQDAQLALGLNGQLLPDIALPSQQNLRDNPDNQKKYFRLNWASGATLSAPIVDLPEFSLFVGDLSASTTEAHLLLFFQKSFPDSIRTVRVMADPITGKSRCFGFVRFTTEAERQRALGEMNGIWFGGRPLRVALATPRASALERHNPDMRAPYYLRNGFSPEFFYGQGPFYPPMMNGEPGQSFGNFEAPNTTVFVGGLLSDVSEKTLYTLFKPFGEILQVKIPPGKNCGFLKYSTRESAEEALTSMEGFIIGGNRVRLGWGRISAKNKGYMRQHMAQAQMHAAAVMSMGMDPAMFPHNYSGPMPQQLPGGSPHYPHMTPPPNMMPYLHNVMGRRLLSGEEPVKPNPEVTHNQMGPLPLDYSAPLSSGYPFHIEHDKIIGAFENLSLSPNQYNPSYDQNQYGQNQFGQNYGQNQYQNAPPMYAPYPMYQMQGMYGTGEPASPVDEDAGESDHEDREESEEDGDLSETTKEEQRK